MNSKTIKKGSLKGLQTYMSKLQGERQVLVMRQDALHEELRRNRLQIKQVQERIVHLTNKALSVTEHAILRYIERVEALPPGEVPSRILTDKLKELVATLGNGTYPMDGYSVLVKDNVVVTVIK